MNGVVFVLEQTVAACECVGKPLSTHLAHSIYMNNEKNDTEHNTIAQRRIWMSHSTHRTHDDGRWW